MHLCITLVINQLNARNLLISIFISLFNQLDAQHFCFTISFISCLYTFRAHVLIIRRSKLHYTAFGIITPIGGRLVHETGTCRCDDEHMCSKHVEAWNKTYCEQTFCVSSWLNSEINESTKSWFIICFLHASTCFKHYCAHHQEVKIILYSTWYHQTYRCDDTECCIIKFRPPDDGHIVLETCRGI